MLSHQLDKENRVLEIRPSDPLESKDFAELAKEIDPFIEQAGSLKGLKIRADPFPGWENFSSFITHLRFIKEHHRRIGKVAFVSDEKLLTMLPGLVTHFVGAEVRHFALNDEAAADTWLRKA